MHSVARIRTKQHAATSEQPDEPFTRGLSLVGFVDRPECVMEIQRFVATVSPVVEIVVAALAFRRQCIV